MTMHDSHVMHDSAHKVVSLAVRRGPYWHLIEVAFYSPLYIVRVIAQAEFTAAHLHHVT